MARGPFTSSNYLSRTDATITAEPITMSAWVYLTDISTASVIISLGDSGVYGNFRLAIGTGGVVRGAVTDDANVAAAGAVASPGSIPVNTWCHAAAVFVSTSSRWAYLNGGNIVENTTLISDPTVNFQTVGAFRRADVTTPALGYIADVAIWSAALTDAEILELSRGVRPIDIRPGSLARYWRLYDGAGDALDSSGNGATLTETGSVPLVSDRHPLVGRSILGFRP